MAAASHPLPTQGTGSCFAFLSKIMRQIKGRVLPIGISVIFSAFGVEKEQEYGYNSNVFNEVCFQKECKWTPKMSVKEDKAWKRLFSRHLK